jgi:predicted metal-binding membrane protein
VNPFLANAGRSLGIRIRSFFWLHPEWWTIGLAGAAWTVMLHHAWRNSGHGVHHAMTLIAETVDWIVMVFAMMLPLITGAVRFTASASLWARRHRAIGGFLLGYLAPWLAVGFAAALLRQAGWTHSYTAPALCFVLAARWQGTTTYKRAQWACHRTRPIAPLGWPADRDCLRFGSLIGLACVRTCWPLMLACEFAGHSPIALVGGMVIGLVEKRRFERRRRPSAFIATGTMAAYYAVLAILEIRQSMTS